MNKRTIVSIVFLCLSVTSFAQKGFVIWDKANNIGSVLKPSCKSILLST